MTAHTLTRTPAALPLKDESLLAVHLVSLKSCPWLPFQALALRHTLATWNVSLHFLLCPCKSRLSCERYALFTHGRLVNFFLVTCLHRNKYPSSGSYCKKHNYGVNRGPTCRLQVSSALLLPHCGSVLSLSAFCKCHLAPSSRGKYKSAEGKDQGWLIQSLQILNKAIGIDGQSSTCKLVSCCVFQWWGLTHACTLHILSYPPCLLSLRHARLPMFHFGIPQEDCPSSQKDSLY